MKEIKRSWVFAKFYRKIISFEKTIFKVYYPDLDALPGSRFEAEKLSKHVFSLRKWFWAA